MEYHEHGDSSGGVEGGGVRSLSNTPSSSELMNNNHRYSHESNNGNDPMKCWWQSISKARSRIQTLISLLPAGTVDLSIADSDRPARSLLDSSDAYSAISSSLSGSGDDPLCHWLYDTFLLDDPDLRLVVLSFVPVVAGLYLSALHSSSTTIPTPGSPSLSGFEAVLLALYSAESKSRAGKPLIVSVPHPNHLAHNPSLYSSSSSRSSSSTSEMVAVGVMCPPLEPQVGIKSTKRAAIIGVAFHSYYTHISQMPPWSKFDLCRFAASWSGDICSCTVSFNIDETTLSIKNDEPPSQEDNDDDHDAHALKIPLPWELLQPMLRILAHCLLGPPPFISDHIKDAASLAVSGLYARASHDLSPQAILATRSLLQLHQRASATAKAAAIAATSFPNTPTSTHKKPPEMLLVSK